MFPNRNTNLCSMSAFVIGLSCFTHVAPAAVIAWWQFEGGNFLADSSGNGYTLNNGSGSQAATQSTDAPSGGGSNSASFDGGDIMNTISNVNLAPYSNLQISWYQKVLSTGTAVAWEQSTNYNSFSGAMIAIENSTAQGTGESGIKSPGSGKFFVDRFSHTSGGSATWQKVVLQIDRNAATNSDVTKIFVDNVLQSVSEAPSFGSIPTFISDKFYFGARSGVNFAFTGFIDEMKIETTIVPEPSSFLLILFGMMGSLRIWKRRQQQA